MIVGFSGKMIVGKTTSSNYLIEKGFVKLSFADKIKEIAKNYFGWDGAKDEKGRKLLQSIGDVGRSYDPDIWIRYVDHQVQSLENFDKVNQFTIDDIRFENEIKWIEKNNGIVIKISRNTKYATNLHGTTHISENELNNYHFKHSIENNGTFEELYKKIDKIINDNRI